MLRSTCSSTRSGEAGRARWAQGQGGGHDHQPQGPRSSLLHCQLGLAKKVRGLCPPRAAGAPGRCCPCPTSWRTRRRTRHLSQRHSPAGGRGSEECPPSSLQLPQLVPGGARSRVSGGRVRQSGGPTRSWGVGCLPGAEAGPQLPDPITAQGGPQIGLDYGAASAKASLQKAVLESPRLPAPTMLGTEGLASALPPAPQVSVAAGDLELHERWGQTDQEQDRVGLGWGPRAVPQLPSRESQRPIPAGPQRALRSEDTAPPALGPPAPGCSWHQVTLPQPVSLPPRPPASTRCPPATTHGPSGPSGAGWARPLGAIYALGEEQDRLSILPSAHARPRPAVGSASPSPASTAPGSCSSLSSMWQLVPIPPGLRAPVAPRGLCPAQSRWGPLSLQGARAPPTNCSESPRAFVGAPPPVPRYKESTAAQPHGLVR